MTEQHFEDEIRSDLARFVESVAPPHPYWADAPASARVAGLPAHAPRPLVRVALGLAMAAGLLLFAVIAIAQLSKTPVATQVASPLPSAPATPAPWPTGDLSSLAPTVGEVPLGQVGVAASDGHPAVLVRVSPNASTRGGDPAFTIEYRVIGPVGAPFGIDRFVVVRDGALSGPVASPGADPLAVAAGTPPGTVVSAIVSVASTDSETVDLGFIGSGSKPVFWFPIHRVTIPSVENGTCPTLADYDLAAALPSQAPPTPSFEPVGPAATPTTGMIQPGEVAVVAAPGGGPGALVRVRNVRFCDRLPDERPEADLGEPTGSYRILMADVEMLVIESGSLGQGVIPGGRPVHATQHGIDAMRVPLFYRFPGADPRTAADPGGGYAYRGTMAWAVRAAGDAGQVAIVFDPADGDVRFRYLVEDGSPDPPTPGPETTPAPASSATASTGEVPLEVPAILATDGGTIPVTVGGVAEVDGYPRLRPTTPGDRFIEVQVRFGTPSAAYTADPSEWVIVGPDGRAARVLDASTSTDANPVPLFVSSRTEPHPLAAGSIPSFALYPVAEVPPTGRITLEYRPNGAPASVTWVLREGPSGPSPSPSTFAGAEPWPTDPALVAAAGERPFGSVTGWGPDGEPPLLVRVTPDGDHYRLDVKVVGPLAETIDLSRVRLLRDGRIAEAVTAADGAGFSVGPGTLVGTELTVATQVAVETGQNLDIAFADAQGSILFTYPVARVAPRTMAMVGFDGSGPRATPAVPDPVLPEQAREIGRRAQYLSVAWSPDGRWFAAASAVVDAASVTPARVDIFAADGSLARTLDGAAPTWLDSGHVAVWSLSDGSVRVVSVADGAATVVPGDWVLALADGRGTLYLAATDHANLGGRLLLSTWRAGTLTARGAQGRPLTLSPDGSILVLSGATRVEGTISTTELLLLRTADFSALPVPDLPGGVGSAFVSPDGRWLAVEDLIGPYSFEIGSRPLVKAPALPARYTAAFVRGWTPDGRVVIAGRPGYARADFFAWRPGGNVANLGLEGDPHYAPTGDGLAQVPDSRAAPLFASVARLGRAVAVPFSTWAPAIPPLAWSPDGTRCVIATGAWDERYQDRLVMVTP